MKQLKLAIIFIIIGSVLRLIEEFLTDIFINSKIPYIEFLNGFLVGFSVGLNLVGIVLLIQYTIKKEKEKQEGKDNI